MVKNLSMFSGEMAGIAEGATRQAAMSIPASVSRILVFEEYKYKSRHV